MANGCRWLNLIRRKITRPGANTRPTAKRNGSDTNGFTPNSKFKSAAWNALTACRQRGHNRAMQKPRCITCLLAACLGFAGGGSAATNRMLVIAPDSLKSALQEFVAYKQNLLPTEFVSLETVLERSSGVDDPEKLKRYLYQQWREHQLGYALLVGDVDVFPVRFMVLDRVTPAAFDYAFYPSDLYYSDLAKQDGSFEDWNARKDSFHAGYFGEVRGEKNKQDPINYDEVDYR